VSFLELEPAARRLRQLAKTYAAGDIPRQDYRRARREIIEELHISFAEQRTGIQSPFDRFSLPEPDPRSELEDEVTCTRETLTPRRTGRIFRRTLVGSFIALLVACAGYFVGQPINAIDAPASVSTSPEANTRAN